MKKMSIILIVTVLFINISFGQVHKYKIEKGQIDYVGDYKGISSKKTVYFKEYGAVESIVEHVEFFGSTMSKTMVITTKRNAYEFDVLKKTGTKAAIDYNSQEYNFLHIDYDNIPDKTREKYSIKSVGTEIIAEKECTIFSLKPEFGTHVKFWIWNNIALKTIITKQREDNVSKATKVDISPNFPSGIFKVPTNYTITEVDLK